MPTDLRTLVKKLPVTFALIALCVAVYLVGLFITGPAARVYNAGALSVWGVMAGRWWTLVTSMFMHGSAIHLLCNMVSLYYLGSLIERLYGSPKFCALYFASGIVGGLVYLLVNYLEGSHSYAVGASGAIFGLFGAYGVLLAAEYARPMLFRQEASRSSLTSFLTMLAMNVFISLTPGIAWEAHLGGLAAGALIGLAYYLLLRRKISERLGDRR